MPVFISGLITLDDDEKKSLKKLQELRKMLENERNIESKILMADELFRLSDKLKVKFEPEVEADSHTLDDMEKAEQSLLRAVKGYNDMAESTSSIYNKKAVKLIAAVLGIKPLKVINTKASKK
jgi:hypothetical protein